jgi:hypothetical protein
MIAATARSLNLPLLSYDQLFESPACEGLEAPIAVVFAFAFLSANHKSLDQYRKKARHLWNGALYETSITSSDVSTHLWPGLKKLVELDLR